MSKEIYSQEDLSRFRSVQKLAYEAVQDVGRRLEEGMTEKRAAGRIDEYLQARGVRHFFHAGFVWFGDRARFKGFALPAHFMPSDRRLEKGMGVILDVAPVVDGYAADIGYALSFGPNPDVDRGIRDLEEFRSLILERVRQERTAGDVYRVTDELLKDKGYVNCHQKYPLGVLGHKVGKLPLSWLPPSRLYGFDALSFVYLGGHALRERQDPGANRTPFLNRRADVPLEPGLWAIEPHIGKGDVGVKWEEMLVVTDSDAYWLDDDLPHVSFWRERRIKRSALSVQRSGRKKTNKIRTSAQSRA